MESQRTLVQQRFGGDDVATRPTRRRIAAPAPPAHEPGEQELVLDRYRLLERLGAGGFGVVWRARDELLHREVAVKRIWLGPDGDSERARREALAAARVAHPAIVALFEACACEDAFYLISELVEGETLAQLIAAGDARDEELLEIGLALLGALAHAHAHGVIHRDIKPHNVLIPNRVGKGGAAAKLTDFGGASLVGEDALTRTGDVLGTLAYMAPEQSEGEEAGEEADLYALALVLYEALSGVNPVRGPTPAATARRIGSELESLDRARSDLPRELIYALDTALAPEPRDRGTVQELRAALEDALDQGLATRRWSERAPRSRVRRAASRPAPRLLPRRSSPPQLDSEQLDPQPAAHYARQEAEDGSVPRRLALPRAVWMAGALALIGWQASLGRAGVALLILAALLPILAMPADRRSRRVGARWLASALAPVLGLAGLAGAFPALAGQATRWRERAAIGALGYWWLVLAEPLLARRLWLGQPAGVPAQGAWEGSIDATAAHVISPLLSLGVLFGALLWALAAVTLPWLVRGRSAAFDVVAASGWSAGIAAATPALAAGLAAHASHPSPRGAVLAAILAATLAVAARALRGPV